MTSWTPLWPVDLVCAGYSKVTWSDGMVRSSCARKSGYLSSLSEVSTGMTPEVRFHFICLYIIFRLLYVYIWQLMTSLRWTDTVSSSGAVCFSSRSFLSPSTRPLQKQAFLRRAGFQGRDNKSLQEQPIDLAAAVGCIYRPILAHMPCKTPTDRGPSAAGRGTTHFIHVSQNLQSETWRSDEPVLPLRIKPEEAAGERRSVGTNRKENMTENQKLKQTTIIKYC